MAQKDENVLAEAARRALNEYQKRWRAANKEKTRKYQMDYWKRRVLKERAEEGGGNG